MVITQKMLHLPDYFPKILGFYCIKLAIIKWKLTNFTNEQRAKFETTIHLYLLYNKENQSINMKMKYNFNINEDRLLNN